LLKEYLDYHPPYARIIHQAINNLFEMEMKNISAMRIEWEKRKKNKKAKVISLKNDRGDR